MEKIEFEANIINDNILEIKLNSPMKNNSAYDITLKGLTELYGYKELPYTKYTYVSELSPCYTTLSDVMLLVGELGEIKPEDVLKCIRENSRLASFYTKKEYKQNDIPFEVQYFVKLKTACTILLKKYMTMLNSVGLKGSLGDIAFQKEVKLKDLLSLLDELKEQLEPLETALKDGDTYHGIKRANRAIGNTLTSVSTDGFSRGFNG